MKFKTLAFLGVVFMLLACSLTVNAQTIQGSVFMANLGDVVFNELMWMGDFAGSSHEWVELRNTTGEDIDLTGWDITKLGSGGEELMLTISSGIIPAQGYFLIANNNAEDSNIAVEPDLVETDVSLSNTKLQLRLYDGLFEEGANLIDTADDGTGTPAGGDGQTMKSMVRKDPPGDGTLAENWYTADTQSGWDDDAQEFGTPQSVKGIVEPIPYEVPAVVISEIMWMGDFDASSHEWIELFNTTDTDIDLSGWNITRLGGEGEQEMVIIPMGVIPAAGYFLISNNAAEDSNLAVEPDLVTADISLSNTKLQLKLYDADGNFIDTADDGTGAPAAGDADAKKAMVRNIPVTDGILSDSWHTADTRSGWDEGAQEYGTPQNSQSVVPTPHRGDVSGDGTISAYDAALILQFVVGLISEFPAESNSSPHFGTLRNYEVQLPRLTVSAGHKIQVPITINDMSGIMSGGIVLRYNPKVLRAVNVLVSAVLSDAYWKANIQRAGEVRIAFAMATAPENPELNMLSGIFRADDDLLYIEFETLPGTEGQRSTLVLDAVQLSESLSITTVDGSIEILPSQPALLQNYPNPFNPETKIPYQLTASDDVTISIYNIRGQLVRSLHLGSQTAGSYIAQNKAAYWNGRDDIGRQVASGVYFYSIQAGSFQATRKMLLLK